MASISTFIAELRRRRVFRVAAFYGGIAFVIIQIIDGAFDYLHIPEWFGTAIIVLLIIGFPIAIGLAWAFDITSEGLGRTDR
ncbi:MAG: adenylyl cyclase, partial [Candidatus Marinimicrobia bacterium]|nr:adenylyl cyclase [Candidatus Neomarinimicrobiota bacterium]